MQTREQLKQNIETAKAAVPAAQLAVRAAECALWDFDAAPEQNVFTSSKGKLLLDGSFKDICYDIERNLLRRAAFMCSVSHTCPPKEYRWGFLVDGVEYVGVLAAEYIRKDQFDQNSRKSRTYTLDHDDTTFSYIRVDK